LSWSILMPKLLQPSATTLTSRLPTLRDSMDPSLIADG
jgi:hypothetical protein